MVVVGALAENALAECDDGDDDRSVCGDEPGERLWTGKK